MQDVLRHEVRDLSLGERAAVDLARAQVAQQREVAETERRLQPVEAREDCLRRTAALETELQDERAGHLAAQADAVAARAHIDILEGRVATVHRSSSWRTTAPLRRLAAVLRRG